VLLIVLDGNGSAQTLRVKAQEAVADRSGAAGGSSKQIMAPNALRSGWLVQNQGANPMYVNDVGADAGPNGGSYLIAPGQYLSTDEGVPLTTGAITLMGTAGDGFVAREW